MKHTLAGRAVITQNRNKHSDGATVSALRSQYSDLTAQLQQVAKQVDTNIDDEDLLFKMQSITLKTAANVDEPSLETLLNKIKLFEEAVLSSIDMTTEERALYQSIVDSAAYLRADKLKN